MSELLTIEGKLRQQTGKGNARRLRREGLVPANLSISGKSTSLEMSPKFLSKAYKQYDRMFNLSVDGKVTKVKIQEVHLHPVKRTLLHLDLIPTA